jgi:hypothetical protein
VLVEWIWQGALAFVVFNATVVFEAGPIRWVGLVASMALLGMWIRSRGHALEGGRVPP